MEVWQDASTVVFDGVGARFVFVRPKIWGLGAWPENVPGSTKATKTLQIVSERVAERPKLCYATVAIVLV